MMFRFLGIQGAAGLAVSVALLGLLLVQKHETRRWRKQSAQFEQLYRGEQAAFAGTVTNYRAAAEAARASDQATVERVRREQQDISERTDNAYEARITDARARARRLRVESAAGSPDSGHRGAAPMPHVSAAAGEAAPAAAQNGLSLPDRLAATEQAIQLDELIKWVRRQARVNPNAEPSTSR